MTSRSDRRSTDPPSEDLDAWQGLSWVRRHLEEARGLDPAAVDPAELRRALEERRSATRSANIAAYETLLASRPEESDALVRRIAERPLHRPLGEKALTLLRDVVGPALLGGRGEDDAVRVWVTCRRPGPEPYLVAAALLSAAPHPITRPVLRVYATVAEQAALAAGREVQAAAEDVERVPEALLRPWFEPRSDGWAPSADLRRCVVHALHDLVQDPPLTRVDLLVCRDLLPFVPLRRRAAVAAGFSAAVPPDGFCLLGECDVALPEGAFTCINHEARLHRRLLEAEDAPGAGEAGTGEVAGAIALPASADAQLIVDMRDAVLVANRAAREQLGIGDEAVGAPVTELAVAGRARGLVAGLDAVRRERESATLGRLAWTGPDGARRDLEVRLSPVDLPEGEVLVAVDFVDVGRLRAAEEELERLRGIAAGEQHELRSAIAQLRVMQGELERSMADIRELTDALDAGNAALSDLADLLAACESGRADIEVRLARLEEERASMSAALDTVLGASPRPALILDLEGEVVWSSPSLPQTAVSAVSSEARRRAPRGEVPDRVELPGRGEDERFDVSLRPLVDAEREPIGSLVELEPAPPSDT